MHLTNVDQYIYTAHFDRERIPERVVHAKGAGAHGVFGKEEKIVWNDI